MTAQLTPPSAPTAAERLRLAAVFGRAVRLAIVLVLVAVGVLLIQTYREILHDAPLPSSTAGPRGESSADSSMSDLLRPGVWSLGDSTWMVARTDLANAAGEERLQSLGQAVKSKRPVSALEEKVLALLRRSRSKAVENCFVYDLPLGPARVRAVTEGQGQSARLRLVQVVWRQSGRPAQLFEAAPAPTAARQETSEDHLLPLPRGAASLARRWQDAGSLSAELLRCPLPLQECLRDWAAAGWSIQTLSSADAAVPMLLLRQGERKLHLCPLQAGSDVISGMMLVTVQQSSTSQGTAR